MRLPLQTAVEKERLSFYQLMRERRRRRQDTIARFENEKGMVFTSQSEIMNSMYTEFSQKFHVPVIDTNFQFHNTLMDSITPCVSPASNSALLEDISMDELECVLKQSHKRKSPGKDGLTVEFYIKFWQIIKGTMLELLNHMLKHNRIHPRQKDGVIILLPKKKGASIVENFRPITLLNNDFKLYTRVATRLRYRNRCHT